MKNEVKTFRELVAENSDKLTDQQCKTSGRCGDACQVWSMRRSDYACKPAHADRDGYFLCTIADGHTASHLGKADWKSASEFGEDPICQPLSRGKPYLVKDNFNKDNSSDVCRECDRPIDYANRRQEDRFTFRQHTDGDSVECVYATERYRFSSLGQCKKTLTRRQWKEIFNNEG